MSMMRNFCSEAEVTNEDGGAGLERAHAGLEVRGIVTEGSLGFHGGGGGRKGVWWLGVVNGCTKVYCLQGLKVCFQALSAEGSRA